MNAVLVSIYKSKKKNEMYLYVEKKDQLTLVPEALLKQFGQHQYVFDLLLSTKKKLARADVNEVLSEISKQGYYLQMPPKEEKNDLLFVHNYMK